jgi:hypothetical protein
MSKRLLDNHSIGSRNSGIRDGIASEKRKGIDIRIEAIPKIQGNNLAKGRDTSSIPSIDVVGVALALLKISHVEGLVDRLRLGLLARLCPDVMTRSGDDCKDGSSSASTVDQAPEEKKRKG